MKIPLVLTLFLLMSVAGCGTPDPDGDSLSITHDEGGENAAPADVSKRPKTAELRSFVFNYNFRLHGLKPGGKLKVWVPKPATGEWQTVEAGRVEAESVPTEAVESQYSNIVRHFDLTVPESGEANFRLPYEVVRKEVRLGDLHSDEPLVGDSFLKANNKVPVEGKAASLLDGLAFPSDPVAKARLIYDMVDGRVRYSKDGIGWGQGDSEWVCDSGFGNCTDFHSLFISLARSKGIPARFEIGFPISTEADSGTVGGYHCWGWFHAAGKGWVPVDISEADKHPELKEYYFGNLTADRVGFSMGRDLVLEPPQEGRPLNFFVYPYVEVDGEVLDRSSIELQFSYDSPK